MSAPPTRRPPTFGPEPWAEVAGKPWCHWDRWYCLVAVLDYDGDLAGVEEALVAALSDAGWGRDATEAKLSHLAELGRRLDVAGLEPADLAGPDDVADNVLVAKARRKLADRGLEGRAMTPAMVDTPRERLVRRARRGRWADFPADPQCYYASFRRHVELKGDVSKNRSFVVVDRLEERLERLDGFTTTPPERLGLYRAFHTAGLELADRADDSFGVVGELRQRAWQTYLGMDWRAAGVTPETYWADLCELVVWEDYGLGFRDELRPFADVAAGEVDLVERLLVALEAELTGFHLGYQAEAAATQIGWLHVMSPAGASTATRRPQRGSGPGTGSPWWPWPSPLSTQVVRTWRWRSTELPTNRVSTRVTSVSAACSSRASTSPPTESYGSCAEHGAEPPVCGPVYQVAATTCLPGDTGRPRRAIRGGSDVARPTARRVRGVPACCVRHGHLSPANELAGRSTC